VNHLKKIIPFLFLVPIIDFMLLFFISKHIGAFATFLWIIGTICIGLYMIKNVSGYMFPQIKSQLQAGKLPDTMIVDGFYFFLAGVLLIIPGPLTDIIALLLFVPFIRRKVIELTLYYVSKKMTGKVIWTNFIKK
jgi:UPF0716 protein FxsA